MEFGINLYKEYETIKNNDYKARIPSEGSALYEFLKEFDQDLLDEEVQYTEKLFVFSMAGFMFSKIYEIEVDEYVAFIENLKYDFKNEDPRLSKSSMQEITKFILEPWIKETGYVGVIGEEDIEYKLDEVVAQSYCKCDFETAMAMYFVTKYINDNKIVKLNDEAKAELSKSLDLIKVDESKEGAYYSGESITLAKIVYNMILDSEVKQFIKNNK